MLCKLLMLVLLITAASAVPTPEEINVGHEQDVGIDGLNPFDLIQSNSDRETVVVSPSSTKLADAVNQRSEPTKKSGDGIFPNLDIFHLIKTSGDKQDASSNSFDLQRLASGAYSNKMFDVITLPTGEKVNPLDHLMMDLIPRLWNAAPNNENGSASEFKEFAFSDTSNDDAVHLNSQQLILRSGYKYELYDAIADDGYITQLTRLVNPLADRSQLRYPPIVMEHGGTIDPTAYLLTSSIQHFPEPWPRKISDGPIRSANRSLAFLLANHGFDVFLCETRGANDDNNRHIKTRAAASTIEGKNDDKNRTQMENIEEATRQWDFWSFTQDDIIAHELKSHIDAVMKVTGAEKVALFSFSLSTPTTFAFLSIRPDYAQKLHGFVSMAPIISGEGTNNLVTLILERICPLIPESFGTLIFTDIVFSQPMRDMIMVFMRSPAARYSIYKMYASLLFGSSAQYRTNIEMNLIGHMLRRLSFKEAKQLCQQMSSNKLQKYDYGPIKNMQLYGTTSPPVYDLSDLKIKDWLLVTAWNDGFSTPKVVEHLLRIINPKPIAHVLAPYNHLDLIAAFDNDKYTNMPILHYFEKMSSTSKDNRLVAAGRSMDFNFAEMFAPLQILNSTTNMFGSANRSDYLDTSARSSPSDISSDPLRTMARSLEQSMRSMFSQFEEAVNKTTPAPIEIQGIAFS